MMVLQCKSLHIVRNMLDFVLLVQFIVLKYTIIYFM